MIDVKIEKILVATDGTPASKKAIKAGINLAKVFHSKIYGICVGEITLPGLPIIEVMERKAKEIVDEVKVEIEKEGIEGETLVVLADKASEAIIQEAQKLDVDLIIVGKKKKRPIFTSVVVPVTAHSPIDVLVIPEESEPIFKRILIAADGSIYSELAAKKGFEIAKRMQSEVYILSVAETEEDKPLTEETIEVIEKLFKDYGVKFETFIEQGEVPENILKFAESKDVDLIVIGSHGRSSENYAIGVVIRKVLEKTKHPLMVVKKTKVK